MANNCDKTRIDLALQDFAVSSGDILLLVTEDARFTDEDKKTCIDMFIQVCKLVERISNNNR
jgi:hypothetical protein